MNIDIVGTEYLPHFLTKTPYISQTPPPPSLYSHFALLASPALFHFVSVADCSTSCLLDILMHFTQG